MPFKLKMVPKYIAPILARLPYQLQLLILLNLGRTGIEEGRLRLGRGSGL